MTGPGLRYAPELADHILQELARGRTLREICGEAGMPGETTVRQWVTNDIEGFTARYRQARETGEPLIRYPTRYTPEIADRIVGALTSGQTLTDFCNEPGIPPFRTVRSWVANNHEDFSERYRQAQEVGRALRGGPLPYSLEQADRVLGELMQGRTLISVCNDPGMPAVSTVMLWVMRDRDGFKARYKETREIGQHIMADELIEIGDDSRGDHITRHGPNGEVALMVDYENIHRSKLRSDNRKWVLGRQLSRFCDNKPEAHARRSPDDRLGEMLKTVSGKTRGLPSEDEPANDD